MLMGDGRNNKVLIFKRNLISAMYLIIFRINKSSAMIPANRPVFSDRPTDCFKNDLEMVSIIAILNIRISYGI